MINILVVDDCDEFRTMLCAALTDAGYWILEASNGQEGLDLYRKEKVAIVIMDIIMPGKEGIETILELRREFPDVKIIAISGGGLKMLSDDCLTMAKKAGAHYVLKKPFAINKIIAYIENLLRDNVFENK